MFSIFIFDTQNCNNYCLTLGRPQRNQRHQTFFLDSNFSTRVLLNFLKILSLKRFTSSLILTHEQEEQKKKEKY